MLITEICTLIGKISPHAKDYVMQSLKLNQLNVIYTVEDKQNQGCFVKAEDQGSCIYYACFENENYETGTLNIVRENILNTVSNNYTKEICFNIYGKNTKLIQLAKELGFKIDMEGYHLELCNENISFSLPKDLCFKSYDENMLEDFTWLFENAYYQLNTENGWSTDSYTKNKDKFNKYLISLGVKNQINSLWKNKDLIGVYIFEENYITDIVVNPFLQRRGYGIFLLNQCIVDIKKNNSDAIIRLRVAKSNINAYRFYIKNGFKEIACFAEHSL